MPAARPADALGDRADLADLGREEREDAVGLAQVEAGKDDRLGVVDARRGHSPRLRRDGVPRAATAHDA